MEATKPDSIPAVTSSLGEGGWRLDRCELFNWGTFDQKVYVLRTDLGSAVITGPNEAGKSTIADGIATLLTPPQQRSYNMAAGAEKSRERDERTYIRGVFGETSTRDGHTLLRLRTEGKPTALLMVMRHANDGRVVSFGRIMWVLANEAHGIYFFAERDLALSKDFSELEDTRTLKARLEKAKLQTFPSHRAFAAQLGRTFNFESSALVLFGRVMSIRETGEVNEFIRDHMLEVFDVSEQLEKLFIQFDGIEQIHEAVERARRQIAELQPVVQRLEQLEKKKSTLGETERLLSRLRHFFALETRRLAAREKARLTGELLDADAALQLAKDAVERQRKDLAKAEAAKAESAEGRQLEVFDQQIEDASARMASKNRRLGEYSRVLVAAGIKQLGVVTEGSFNVVRTKAEKDIGTTDGAADHAFAQAESLKLKREDYERQCKALVDEISDLGSRSGRIRGPLHQARRQIAGALGLKEDELPFVAELLEVAGTDEEWRASLESLLRSFGFSLVVAPDHYEKIVHYLRTHTLDDVKVTYYQAKYLPPDRTRNDANDAGRIVSKLRFKPQHALAPWLADSIRTRFPHVCCDTETAFRSERYAILRERKSRGGDRHDKDDRLLVLKPENFILGWNNEVLRQQLRVRADELLRKITALKADEKRQREIRQGHGDRALALRDLLRFGSFSEINGAADALEAERLRKEKTQFLARSDKLRALEEAVDKARRALAAADETHANIVGKVAELNSDLERATNYDQAAASRLSDLPPGFDFEGLAEPYRGFAGKRSWELATMGEIENDLSHQLKDRERAQTNELNQAAVSVRRAMQDFLGKFPEFGTEMRAEETQGDAFTGLQRRLVKEDLPRRQDDLRRMMDKFTQDDLSQLQLNLRNRVRADKRAIEGLNSTLGDLGYGQDTFIEIDAKDAGGLVATFKTELSHCLDYNFNATDQERDQAIRAARDLIAKLRKDDKYRRIVTDTRQWLTFGVCERRRATKEEVMYFSTSAGRSGGGRAKLAYTILCAAIAKQYGLLGSKPENTFRLVVVDEMFGVYDEKNSRYALDLFHRFGLQLLCVCPLSPSARVVDNYARSFHLVTKPDGRTSTITTVTYGELEKQRSRTKD